MTRTPGRAAGGQRGFSIAEMMIAMVVTMIVTGAIYGLITSSGNSFRREPLLSDRQQNIRIAMDRITRDLQVAGGSMQVWEQIFTKDGMNDAGPAEFPSVMVAGEKSDILEFKGNDGTCPDLSTCREPGVNVFTLEPIPSCFGLPSFVYVYPGPSPTPYPTYGNIHFAYDRGGGSGGQCSSDGDHANFPPGLAHGWNPQGGFCDGSADAATCQKIMKVNIYRFQIAADPEDGEPALWRSPFSTLNPNDYDGALLFTPPGGGWQLIARGIEDMQVEYLRESDTTANNGSMDWFDTPGAVTGPNYDTLVRQVRVTLSGRAIGQNLAGMVDPEEGTAPAAIRGRLTTLTAPRMALYQLSSTDVPEAARWR